MMRQLAKATPPVSHLITHDSKTAPKRRNAVVRGHRTYCDMADAMLNASVHIPSSRAKKKREKKWAQGLASAHFV